MSCAPSYSQPSRPSIYILEGQDMGGDWMRLAACFDRAKLHVLGRKMKHEDGSIVNYRLDVVRFVG
jgi:hypothetical protein